MTFEQKLFPDLTGGINSSVLAEKIADNQSPYILNMVVDGGILTKDWGFTQNDEAITGDPKLIYEFHKKDSITEIILVTTTRILTWKMGTWIYIGDDETTMDGEYTHEDGSPYTVADGSIFTTNDYVGITLEDGTQFVAVVSNVSGNDISLSKTLGINDVILDGARIIRILELNGTQDVPVKAATFPASDALIITNGKDDVMVYDGDLCVPIPNLVTAVGGGNCTARTVLVKDNKVILFNMNENGSDYPQRVRWCATGDYTDWTTSGDAGYEDRYNDSYHIIAAEILGPSIIIYKEKSIEDMRYVGSADFIYTFTTMLQTVGAASPWAVVNRGDYHMVLDIEYGFYKYAGGYSVEPFGSTIYEEIFGPGGNLSKIYKQAIFTAYLESRHTYIALIPINGSTIPNMMYMYNTDYNCWTKREFLKEVVGLQEILLVTGITWADAEGAWEDSDWVKPWNDVTVSTSGYKALLWVYNNYTRGIFEYSSAATTDEVATEDYQETTGWYITPELVNPQGNVRVDRIKVKGSGTSIYIEYSTDAGETWTEYGTLTPGSAVIASSCYKQVVSTRIRFRLSGTDMSLAWAAVYWNKEDEE